MKPTGRIREKYNPIPTAREKAYHLWLLERYPCSCGCGRPSTVVHHPLTRHPKQRWRRDHEYVVPMDGDCHMELHRLGHERDQRFAHYGDLAHHFRGKAIGYGMLGELSDG